MPHIAPRRSRLALVGLALSLLCAACDDDGDASEEDLIAVGDTAADTTAQDTTPPTDTGDVVAQDTATPTDTNDDTAQLDVALDTTDAADTTDAGDPCEGAVLDAPCEVAETWCGECGPTSCTFCNLLYCSEGLWQRVEAFPDPDCHDETCSPLDETSRCDEGEGCYWDPDLGVFACGEAGAIEPENGCTGPGDCVPGALCLQRGGTSAPQCYIACDPDTDDGICGGPCDSLGEHGYDNGAGQRIHDVGFCYFLGG